MTAWLLPPHGVCALSGYTAACSGPLQWHHILNKSLARGNEEVRAILAACPKEVIVLVCQGHNVGRWADTSEARKILLLQKIYDFGWSHMAAYINGLPWKVRTPDLTLEGMLG